MFKKVNTTCAPTCAEKCSECDEKDQLCVLCEYGYTLYEGQCYSTQCESNCLLCNESSRDCITCANYYFVADGKCRVKSISMVFVFLIVTLTLYFLCIVI